MLFFPSGRENATPIFKRLKIACSQERERENARTKHSYTLYRPENYLF